MYIYEAVNKINGKNYIGKTTTTLEARKSGHLRLAKSGGGTDFQDALREYGEEAFEWSIIDTAETEEELNEKEKFWIKEKNAYENGYNRSYGGEGGSPVEVHYYDVATDSFGVISSLSEAAEKFGMSQSASITLAIQNQSLVSNRFYLSYEPFEQKPEFTYTARKNKNTGEVQALYTTIKLAAEDVGGNIQSIHHALSKRYRTSAGYVWEYTSNYDEDFPSLIDLIKVPPTTIERPQTQRRYGSIIQLTTDGKYVATFSTQFEAASETGAGQGGISNCLQGSYKHAGGFVWIYEEDFEKGLRTSYRALETSEDK